LSPGFRRNASRASRGITIWFLAERVVSLIALHWSIGQSVGGNHYLFLRLLFQDLLLQPHRFQ
jgi:hypothetical protein